MSDPAFIFSAVVIATYVVGAVLIVMFLGEKRNGKG